jgi:GNAT superfamily N-acetyltransferase
VAEIDVHEVAADRPDLFEALTVAWNETDAEVNPDDPPAPSAELTSGLFARTSERHHRCWLAFLDGEPAGVASFELESTAENRHVATNDWLAVRPRVRRRGVADALLRVALDQLGAQGRTSLVVYGPDTPLARAYADRLGLESRIVERCSRVRVEDIPDQLIDTWLDEGRTRTDGYRLVRLEGRCPDELLPAYRTATAAMVDAPTDGLDYTPTPADDARLRSREAMWHEVGLAVARCLVLAPDGGGAGMSELFVNGHRPVLAHQGDTGVARAHRGRGLGRWLKAENLRWAQELAPGFEVIETWNAQSNPWMLDINVAMGFRPHGIWHGFQGELEGVRAALG